MFINVYNAFERLFIHNFLSLSASLCKKYPVILKNRISQDESYNGILCENASSWCQFSHFIPKWSGIQKTFFKEFESQGKNSRIG